MIIKNLFVLILFIVFLNAKDFKVASYNVENLFDLKYDGTEYNEYRPNSKSNWNKKTYDIKLKNISRVINELNADIIALQEVESKKALKDLLNHLPKYKYYSFIKNKKSAIGTALLSKYEIISTNKIDIKTSNKYSRPIQKNVIKIDDKNITIFNNHWPSKRAAENERIEYALTLYNYLKNKHEQDNYILLGDFNSNYNEYQSFIRNKKLNNSYGITGINQVLNTTINRKFIMKNNIQSFKKIVHYNLWLDKEYQNRFSYKYKGANNTPDNILVSSSLFDNKNISYINNSFNVFKPTYLYNNNQIKRWEISYNKKVHKAIGYSDHLPIYATFSTKNRFKAANKNKKVLNISDLYKYENLENKIKLYNVIVIYKDNSSAIIKQENSRAVYVYKKAHNLELGKIYDIDVEKIKTYNGLKEIVNISKIALKNSYVNHETLYTDANKINILEYKYQNEIITNLKAIYKKGYLYYNYNNQDKRIKLYCKFLQYELVEFYHLQAVLE
jgi:endonuclease/exonuclease/phosphatase family metal-dependent hydrolase